MGLDATVYCDCFEKGRLRTAPMAEWHVYIDDYGGRSARTGALEKDLLFDQWNITARQKQLRKLVDTAMALHKPISF